MDKSVPIKIMIVINALDVGGAEMDIVRNFPQIQQDSSFEIIAVLYDHCGPLAEKLIKSGITVHSPKEIARKNPLKSFWRKHVHPFFYILKLINTEKPAILHAFLPRPYIYASFARILSKHKPLFFMSRLSLNYYFQKHPFFGWIERNICHKSGVNRFIGNALCILDELQKEGAPKNRMSVLYNGIETKEFTTDHKQEHFLNTNIFRLTATGNLFAYKGYDDLLAALQMLKKNAPEIRWHMHIAGENKENNLSRYKNLCQEYGIDKNITFHGRVSNMAKFLQPSHLHIHPSHTEGLPNSIIEAMSAELPILATNVGGIPELVEEGINGALVKPNSPDELHTKLTDLLATPIKLYTMGQAGKEKADNAFNLRTSAARYITLYKAALKSE